MKKLILALFFNFYFLIFVFPVKASTYSTYINSLPVPAPITSTNQPIVDKLVAEINRIPADATCGFKHLAPGLFKNSVNGNSYPGLYWISPSEVISALSAAYPYLPSTLQAKVKTYLGCEIASFNPLTVGFYPPNSSNNGVSDQAGVRREPFPIDPKTSLNFWPGYPPVTIQVAYSVWQYTYYTGDQTKFLTNTSNWNTLTSIFDNFYSKGVVKYYTEVAGLTGFARLAQMKGDTTRAQQATALANSAMTGSEFTNFAANGDYRLTAFDPSGAVINSPRATVGVFADGSNSNCCNTTFVGIFAKEIGQFLHDNEQSAAQVYSAKIEKIDPLWFLTNPNFGGDWTPITAPTPSPGIEREVLLAKPEFAWTNFMLHAYVLGEPFSKLSSYLDFSSRLGDWFYIQQLVTTIEAAPSGGPTSTPSPSPASSPTPVATPTITIGNGDVNVDGKVDSADIKLVLGSWWQNLTGTVDQFGDGLINSLDFAVVFKNLPVPTTPTPTSGAFNKTAFQIGPGGSDTISHQIVRTAADKVYIFGYAGDGSNILEEYWATGLPNTAADFTHSTLTYPATIISVDTVYDGGNIIHVLTNDTAGNLLDRPFDTTSNTFKTVKTLATGNPTIDIQVGTAGVSGLFDTLGTLHVAYWSNGNHITYRTYTYNAASDTLTLTSGPTQIDGAESTNNNHPSLAISPVDNSVTLAWVSGTSGAGNIFVRVKSAGGTWNTAVQVNAAPAWTDPSNGTNIDQTPSVLITSDGIKHIAYIENWRVTSPFDYGRVHYVRNSGSGWTDVYTGSYSHDPGLATNSNGDLYILGHGYALNTGGCTDNNDMCQMKRNADGTWTAQQILIAHTASAAFDSSPSIKWSIVGWNRNNVIEYIAPNVFNGYNNSSLYYGRL